MKTPLIPLRRGKEVRGWDLLIHSETEEGEVAFGWVVRPDFSELLGEFHGGTHTCALACDKS